MKKWIYSIMLFFLILICIPPLSASADAGGSLTAEAQKVTVTLQKPQEEPEPVTSLRCWLYLSVLEGEIGQPVFEFADTIFEGQTSGSIRSAAVSGQGGRYVVDLILSGKQDQDIFAGKNQAVIGTLKLPASSSRLFRVYIAFAGEQASAQVPDNQQPVLQYMSSTSQSVQTVPLSGVNPVICTDEAAGPSFIPDIPSAGYPAAPAIPSDPKLPAQNPDLPQSQEETAVFKKKAVPKLKLSAANESRRISFRWNRIDGADGYQIYRYEADTKRYTRIKTIPKADKTAYSKAMEYGTAYAFRIRAFRTEADGNRTYGKFSAIVKVTTAPSKVTKLSAKKLKSGKAVLTWQPADAADGYQIYRSTKKNGAYSRIKTIRKGEAGKYSGISQTQGRTYYYKVRAYVAGADGKRIYGKFSRVKQLVSEAAGVDAVR